MPPQEDFCGGAFFVHGGDHIYIYPDNLNAKATLWLWQLRDLAVIGIGLLIAVLALTQLGLFLPMVLVAAYAFLSIHLDGLSVLDFLSFVVSFYITEQQILLDMDALARRELHLRPGGHCVGPAVAVDGHIGFLVNGLDG